MAFCAGCGNPRAAEARFCGSCGRAATVPSPAPIPSPARATATAVLTDVRRLPLGTLVPLRAWWESRLWQQQWIGLFLIVALTPFFLLHLGGDPDNFHRVSWGFSLYFAFLWFLALHTLIRPEPVPWQTLAKVALFTIVAGVAIAIGLEERLLSDDPGVLGFIFGVGLPEEFAKALAVYLFLYRSPQVYGVRAFLFVGAVSGLAFGAAEAVSYSTAYASVLPFVSDAHSTLVAEVWRLVTDSLFHACMAGICAFFLGLARRSSDLRLPLLGFGLVFAALLHGLYDTFASDWIGTGIAVLIVFVFVGYVAKGEEIGEQLTADA